MHSAGQRQSTAEEAQDTQGHGSFSSEAVERGKTSEAVAAMSLASLLYYVLIGEGRGITSADPA